MIHYLKTRFHLLGYTESNNNERLQVRVGKKPLLGYSIVKFLHYPLETEEKYENLTQNSRYLNRYSNPVLPQ
jgi:hypothetical protein